MTKLRRPFPDELADYWRQEVTAAFPEAMIDGFDYLLPVLTNDEKDRHVLAAAIHGAVSVIVTFNLRHFPEASLKPWNVAAVHPQDYLLTLYSINPSIVLAKLVGIARDHNEDLQDALIHVGQSVPAFSRRVLEDSGKNST